MSAGLPSRSLGSLGLALTGFKIMENKEFEEKIIKPLVEGGDHEVMLDDLDSFANCLTEVANVYLEEMVERLEDSEENAELIKELDYDWDGAIKKIVNVILKR